MLLKLPIDDMSSKYDAVDDDDGTAESFDAVESEDTD
jgi:hypothetical protein